MSRVLQLEDRFPTFAVARVLQLRQLQAHYQRIVDLPGIRESAKQSAQAQVEAIERRICHGR